MHTMPNKYCMRATGYFFKVTKHEANSMVPFSVFIDGIHNAVWLAGWLDVLVERDEFPHSIWNVYAYHFECVL